MKAECVLDASAILAVLFAEPGSQKVQEWMRSGAAVSAVNLAEVATELQSFGVDDEQIHEDIEALQLVAVPFDQTLAYLAARLHRKTFTKGLSLGDRACLATASHLGLPAVTADRSWKIAGLGINVQTVR